MNHLQNNTRKLTPAEAILRFASQYIGLQEIKGAEDNPMIVQMFEDIGHGWVKDDETAWCSCFVNWVAMQVGCVYSNRLDARSWLDTGTNNNYPKPGDIVVLWRENKTSWKGHVGIFIGFTKAGNISILGGNQRNEVNITEYPSNRLLGFRELHYTT